MARKNDQPALFGTNAYGDTVPAVPLTNPIAHAADPQSSHEAAEKHTASGKRARHAEIVLALVKKFPGQTALELWDDATVEQQDELKEYQEIRRRLTDLEKANLIRQGPTRRCSVRFTPMLTWEAV